MFFSPLKDTKPPKRVHYFSFFFTEPGCDELGMGILPFGSATRESDGAMYRSFLQYFKHKHMKNKDQSLIQSRFPTSGTRARMVCKWLGRTRSSATATHGMGLSPCARVSAVKQSYYTKEEEEKNDYKWKEFFWHDNFSSTSFSSTAGGESGWGVNLNFEARNHGSHNLHSPGPLLKAKHVCQLMRFIVFQEGNPHPEVGITFNGQPVESKEFRRGRNTFTFTGFFSSSNGYVVELIKLFAYNWW